MDAQLIDFSLNFITALVEVLAAFYLFDHLFSRTKTVCNFVLVCAFSTLVAVGCFTDELWIRLAATLLAYLAIAFLGYGGFCDVRLKLLMAVVLLAIGFIWETVGLIIVFSLFGFSDYGQLSANAGIMAIYVAVNKLMLFLSAVLLARLRTNRSSRIMNGSWIGIFSVSAIGIVVLFAYAHSIWKAGNADYSFTILFALSILAFDIIIIRQYDSLTRQAETETRLQVLESKFKTEHAQYEQLLENRRQISAMRHDLKKHIYALNALVDNQEYDKLNEYIDRICADADHAFTFIDTGNLAIDAIMNEKLTAAKKLGIPVKIDVRLTQNLPVDEVNMVIVLGNAMDNAIEACAGNRQCGIDVRLHNSDVLFYAEISNPILHTPVMEQERFATSKADRKFHGYGIDNMKRAAQSMGAVLNLNTGDGTFTVSLTLRLCGLER